jgi:hypothetical protein
MMPITSDALARPAQASMSGMIMLDRLRQSPLL